MSATARPPLEIRDVTLRDGLQLTGKPLSVERKVEIVRALIGAGVTSLEIGSMARPDLVPSMGNTTELVERLEPDELERCWLWVATPGHVKRALQAGAHHLQFCLSASSSHNRANLGRDTDTSLATMPEAIDLTLSAGGRIQLCIATAFTCPFEGSVSPDLVLAIANDPRTRGAEDIVICDTLGQAFPDQVASLIRRVRDESPERRILFHGHDTWGQGLANSLAAYQAGAAMVDASLGGLGGCPFAPGASGNAATEDLLFATRPDWLTPTTFHTLVDLGQGILHELDEPNRSRAVQGALAGAAAFPWSRSTLPA
ncbi:hydroxymethylglutaryl-CoA lyase [Nocardioides sp. cx-173]|uniref:hydroxymethylglutaryl-CoA lyase n=1 Tax=Nocardioides sp. cx-173 TaxID=2898796 RepID=UPI001E45FFF9|nr:hydroxymethylglutaryl-CoA lyase [Nocardioides sp. cx-173]MCD4524214.1 hydroxymethylglutaryl-CoA lyase [Nocardioides sp. cx-173]UGB41606.1 hydroxymethylglutaryl-CoA lyase [Nocardioides sp. cx-173]